MIERILELIKKSGITNNKLLSDLKLPISAISEWKKGKAKPSVEALVKIADYFDVSVDYLLGRKGNGNFVQYNYNVKAKNYIIGYVDLLGIKKQMNAENQSAILQTMHSVYSSIMKVIENYNARENKLISCPIEVKIFSDNILFALEYDENTILPYTYHLCNILMMFQAHLLLDTQYYFLLRGGVCTGDLYIDNVFACGSGLVNAYYIEDKEAHYPRILLEDSLAMRLMDFLGNADRIKEVLEQDYDKKYYLKYLHYVEPKELLCHKQVLIENERLNKGNNAVIEKNNWAKLCYNRRCAETGMSELAFADIDINNAYGTSSDSTQPKFSLADGLEDDTRAVAYDLDNKHYIPEDDEDEIKTT